MASIDITNAEAMAVAIGSVSDMDISKGEFHSTGPAFWSYSYSKDDICRPVSSVRTHETVMNNDINNYHLSSKAIEEINNNTNEENEIPRMAIYGAPDYNAMIAASMYNSIRENYSYILQTQYGVGMDNNGNIWGSVSSAPLMQQKQQNLISSSDINNDKNDDRIMKKTDKWQKPLSSINPLSIGHSNSAFPSPQSKEGCNKEKTNYSWNVAANILSMFYNNQEIVHKKKSFGIC